MRVSTTVRVEEESYKNAKEILSRFGLSFSDGVNMFVAKMAMVQGLPFDVTLPTEEYSEELLQRAKNIESGENLQEFDSVDSLFEDLGI